VTSLNADCGTRNAESEKETQGDGETLKCGMRSAGCGIMIDRGIVRRGDVEIKGVLTVLDLTDIVKISLVCKLLS
jgi:hypothetical protein